MLGKPEGGRDPDWGGEALSRALSLKKPAASPRSLPSEIRQRTISAGKSQFPEPRSKPRALANDSQLPLLPQKDKKSSSSSSSNSSSIWNWKPLRALSHIRHRRFNCLFTLHVHSVDGLPPSFNGTALCVRWKRNIAELGLCTRHSQISHGVAKFEETLEHRCAVYGSRGGGPHHTAKYEARQFILYASVVGAPEVDLGKHRVDLTRLLPLTLEELEKGSTGKWSTSFKLSGKGRHASLNVSFGSLCWTAGSCRVWRSQEGDGHNAPEYLPQLFASGGELSVCNFNNQAESMSDSELIMEELESTLDNLSIFESGEFEAKNAEEESLEEPCYMNTNLNNGMGEMSTTLSLDDVTDTVASEFLSMLGIEDCPFEFSSDSDPESPRERLWQQFKNESLVDVESIFGLEMEGETELDWCDSSEDFDLSSMIHAAETEHQKATQALQSKTRAQMLEHAEAEALMHELGLDENSFHNSPPGARPLDLPPLSEGLGPFVQTKDGGFLRSMNPSLFGNSQHNGSLIMQVSSPVVVPAEMGSSAMEILQCLASVGIEKLSMQASKLMPLEDITGKTMQQVAWEAVPALGMQERSVIFILPLFHWNNSECLTIDLLFLSTLSFHSYFHFSTLSYRQDFSKQMMLEAESGLGQGTAGKNKRVANSILSSSSKVGHDYVSLEDLAPLAIEKIEALSIEGLRIQSGMSDKDNCISLGLDGAAGLQLLDIEDCVDEVDGLMGLSITLDEWMKLDSGIIDEDQISDRTSKILAAHHATSTEMVPGGCKGDRRGRSSGRKWGLLGNNFTVALMVQLRDPLRNYEPVGTPMLSLIQVERVFVPPKPRIYCTVSDGGNSEQAEEPEATVKAAETKEEEEAVSPQFKITGVHVAGLKTDPGERKIWGSSNHQQSGSRWLLANGMGKANKHPLMKSKPSQASTSQHNAKAQPGEALWSISSRFHGKGSKWKELPSLNPHRRNPNIILQ
ncbi:unnamed protein product [Spirodela intermedia]|uniref:C2 NT-type domain-containing protein n=1 Tax=Spirodela intermedia TaxID=51605 RepID=A0A7I8IV89_SPIIN|nr:unnamed protein product [Spirodela intermedia]CAA6660903.1 unnamed protein product [Spirodela intermedia]